MIRKTGRAVAAICGIAWVWAIMAHVGKYGVDGVDVEFWVIALHGFLFMGIYWASTRRDKPWSK